LRFYYCEKNFCSDIDVLTLPNDCYLYPLINGENGVLSFEELVHKMGILEDAAKDNPGKNSVDVFVAPTIIKRGKFDLITGQILKFLIAINSLTSKVEVCKAKNEKLEELPTNFVTEVKYLKVKIAYQSVRDKNKIVKNFMEKTKFFECSDNIGNSLTEYENFVRYI